MGRQAFKTGAARSTVQSMEERNEFNLDEAAGLALDVALHAARANGDTYCGTEYILYGLVATARGDLVELTELFTLNTLRIDRSIDRLIEQRRPGLQDMATRPMLSRRSKAALATPRIDQTGPTGCFELLHGLLLEDQSGACSVLRDLGVNPCEARRLVSYGLRHLSREEVDELIATLDRRGQLHQPWWGPNGREQIRPVPLPGRLAIPLADSASARVELTAIGTDGAGFGFTITTRSLCNWVLPPVFVPVEALIPGRGSAPVDGPDFFLLQLTMPDGSVIDNRHVEPRYSAEAPARPRLVRLGQRDETTTLNDRRRHDQHVITSDWWVWPQPGPGALELRVDWPAESITGAASLDSESLFDPSV